MVNIRSLDENLRENWNLYKIWKKKKKFFTLFYSNNTVSFIKINYIT